MANLIFTGSWWLFQWGVVWRTSPIEGYSFAWISA